MFAVYVDGKLLYDTKTEDKTHIILNPKISLEENKPGLFSFSVPPVNALYDSMQKVKSIITLEQDGEEIFRGRVVKSETNFFKQKDIECKSELVDFKDSIQRPYEFEGTPMGLFRQIITTHNEMVNEDQRFSIGSVTAVQDSGTAQVDTNEYANTLEELESRMINAYGGILRVRHAGGVRYIDYLADGDENTQPIAFGVNLLDLKKHINANDVFNVLIPKGAMQKGSNGRYTEALKITDVNGGKDYIEDEAAIAKYGKRIWQTKFWDNIEDAEKLLEKGREYLATGITEEATLTITAVDMRFVDKEKRRIGIGDKVRILSEPHGMDRIDRCTKLEMELMNPEKAQYTFGKPRKSLTDNVILAKKQMGGGGGRRTIQEEVSEIQRWAKIAVNEAFANITLQAGEINNLTGKVTQAFIEIDGIKSEITLKADKIDLQGYVTAEQLETTIASFDYVTGDFSVMGAVSVGGILGAGGVNIESSFVMQEYDVSWKSKSVMTGLANLQSVKIDGVYYRVLPETGLGYTTSTIYYLGR